MSDVAVAIALPHMIGRFLGCEVTDYDGQKNCLMYRGRAEGLQSLPGAFGFIPKDCANIMNPSP
jgi:hypothetical protein